MPLKLGEKIKGDFVPQLPASWIKKLPPNMVGYTFYMALYIWHLKGVKKTNRDLVITQNGINSFLPIPEWAFSKTLKELEKYGMIVTKRQSGKSPLVTIICEDCFESYPVLKI